MSAGGHPRLSLPRRRAASPTTLPGAFISRFEPGEPTYQTRPGDYVLTRRRRDLLTDAVVVAELARLRRPAFNHAALVVGVHGELIEVTLQGVRMGNLDAYRDERRVAVSACSRSVERARVCRWAHRRLCDYDPEHVVGASVRAVVGMAPGPARTAPQLVVDALRFAGVGVGDGRGALAALHAIAGP